MNPLARQLLAFEIRDAIGRRDLYCLTAGIYVIAGAGVAGLADLGLALLAFLPVGAAFARAGVLASHRADSIIARAVAAELPSNPEPIPQAA